MFSKLFEQYIGFEKKKQTKQQRKFPFAKVISFIVLAAFCSVWVLPFIIMFTGSLRGYIDNTLYPKELFYPHSGYTLENFEILLTGVYPDGVEHNLVNGGKGYPVARWFLNSCISALGGTLLYLFVASLAAYAFTFIPFKYSNVLFTVLIFSMVIPGAATTVGNQMIVFGTGLNEIVFVYEKRTDLSNSQDCADGSTDMRGDSVGFAELHSLTHDDHHFTVHSAW